jgi:Flp pilus assembly protein TadG
MLTRALLASRRLTRQRGSMTVELVILAPMMIALMMFLVLAGWVTEARGQADSAARDAARAASIASSPGQAQTFADQAIQDDNGSGLQCAAPDVQGFSQDGFAVTVTVHCTLNLSFLSFINGGVWHITGHAVAPLDEFVHRT